MVAGMGQVCIYLECLEIPRGDMSNGWMKNGLQQDYWDEGSKVAAKTTTGLASGPVSTKAAHLTGPGHYP